VSTYREVDTKQAGAKRRRWPEGLKRQLVAETLEPGASVSVVARRHDVNANQLFAWRRQFTGPTRVPRIELLPIEICPEPGEAITEPEPTAAKPLAGSIEIAVPGGVRVRIEGTADPAAVTAAIAAVMKARRRR
jgi:transposase